jgi:hypothetical protein
MPPPRRALPGLNMLDLGFPNQRAVGKKPRVWPTRMRGQEVLYDGVIILIDMVDPCWIWTCASSTRWTRATRSGVSVICRGLVMSHLEVEGSPA